MVTMPVTLGDFLPQTTPISTFCVAFHIFVVGEVHNILQHRQKRTDPQP